MRSSQTRAGTHVPALAGEFFTMDPPGKPCLKYFADQISFFNDALYNVPKEGKGEKDRAVKEVMNGFCYHLTFMIETYHTLLTLTDSMEPRLKFIR